MYRVGDGYSSHAHTPRSTGEETESRNGYASSAAERDWVGDEETHRGAGAGEPELWLSAWVISEEGRCGRGSQSRRPRPSGRAATAASPAGTVPKQVGSILLVFRT